MTSTRTPSYATPAPSATPTMLEMLVSPTFSLAPSYGPTSSTAPTAVPTAVPTTLLPPLPGLP